MLSAASDCRTTATAALHQLLFKCSSVADRCWLSWSLARGRSTARINYRRRSAWLKMPTAAGASAHWRALQGVPSLLHQLRVPGPSTTVNSLVLALRDAAAIKLLLLQAVDVVLTILMDDLYACLDLTTAAVVSRWFRVQPACCLPLLAPFSGLSADLGAMTAPIHPPTDQHRHTHTAMHDHRWMPSDSGNQFCDFTTPAHRHPARFPTDRHLHPLY